jgi:hypothetical protein
MSDQSTGLMNFPRPAAAASGPAGTLSTVTAEQLQDLIGPWLPRLQLFTSNSQMVKERRFPAGHWGIPLTPTTIIDIGGNVDVVLGAMRDKALIASGEAFQCSTDKESALYKKIRDMAMTDRDSGAMFGPEFLVWIGQQQLFATIFLGTVSARREGYAFVSAMDKPAVLGSQLVGSNPRKRWEVPTIAVGDIFPYALPDEHAKAAAWKKFQEAGSGGEEEVAPGEAAPTRER